MESLFYGTFGPIGALVAISELIEYVEPLNFFWQVESSPNIGQKRLLCKPLAIHMLNIFVGRICSICSYNQRYLSICAYNPLGYNTFDLFKSFEIKFYLG